MLPVVMVITDFRTLEHKIMKIMRLLSDVAPTASDLKYTIELANGKIIGTDSIIRGCTLNFLSHPFNIDSILVELGSFNGIISMDWLSKSDGYASIVASEQRAELFDRIGTLEWDNMRLRGMLGVERQRVDRLRHKIRYHPGKANIVAYALSRKELTKPLRVRVLVITINSNLPLQIHEAQVETFEKENVKDENLHGIDKEFVTHLDETLCIRNKSWLPRFRNLREMTMYKSHKSNYSIHSRSDKTYHNLKQLYQWLNMEAGIAIYATKDNKQLRHDLGNRDHQKDYTNVRHKPLEFQVGDKVMLKVSPWKGMMHFGKRGMLNPRYIRPFKILAKVGTVAYRLKLSQQLSKVHNTFHVSDLKKCLSNETLVIPLDEIQINEKLHFIEEPVEIMDREVKRLNQSRIPLVKVCWNSRRGLEFTWEREDQFQKKYLHLFAKPVTVPPSTS
ncbi:hypothetical protein Tco_0321760 [Tanacetum coccineum]